MAAEVKLEPGWLTRDVNRAAERAKALDFSGSNKKEQSQDRPKQVSGPRNAKDEE
jgi:hypothetical protein